MHTVAAASRARPVVLTLAPVDYTDLRRFPSAEALADDICASAAAGASVVHFHVTDAKGQATSDTSFFDGVVRRVREKCDIIIQGSTGGIGVPWDVRMAALGAHGLEMASLNMGSCNLFGRAYVNTPDDIAAVTTRLDAAAIVPDRCFFEPGFFSTLPNLGVSGSENARRLVASICLGFPGALPASVENLTFMISKLPAGAEWTLVHHGAADFALLAAALAAGGNLRIGCEDSSALGGGKVAKTNAELVHQARVVVEQLGRTVATPAETRRRYGIQAKPTAPVAASAAA